MAPVGADQAIVELEEVTKLLHLIFHRNKNQHHLAKWWKWLSMLRRCLLKLPRDDVEAVKARVFYMADFLIPRCHRAFTNLVADQQFAVLGLVLLANLAKVGRVVGAMAGRVSKTPVRDARHVPRTWEGDEDLGESIVRSNTRDAALGPQPEAPRSHHHTTPNGLELGDSNIIASIAPGGSEPFNGSPSSSPKRKGRRAKDNAIDELFSRIA